MWEESVPIRSSAIQTSHYIFQGLTSQLARLWHSSPHCNVFSGYTHAHYNIAIVAPLFNNGLSNSKLLDSNCLAVTNGEIAGSLLSSVSGIFSLSYEVNASLYLECWGLVICQYPVSKVLGSMRSSRAVNQ